MLIARPIQGNPVSTGAPLWKTWPSGRVPGSSGRWSDKGLLMYGSYTARAWWLDKRNTLHAVTPDALPRWFDEPARFDTSTAWTGGLMLPSGALGFIVTCPIGATVDGVTSPAQAFGKPWNYTNKPVGGNVLIIAGIGGIWWLESSLAGSGAHWVRDQAAANQLWGYSWRYPPFGKWGKPSDLDSHAIGPNLTY